MDVFKETFDILTQDNDHKLKLIKRLWSTLDHIANDDQFRNMAQADLLYVIESYKLEAQMALSDTGFRPVEKKD